MPGAEVEEDPLLAKAAESGVTGKAVDADKIHKHIVELKVRRTVHAMHSNWQALKDVW